MHKSLLGLALLAVGCGPYLQYRALPPAPAPAGKVIVEVQDNREPGKGGLHKDQVGVMTGTFGIPNEVHATSPTEVADVMRNLVSQAALSAGLGVAAPGDTAGATGKIVVEVQRLWCAGYHPVYKGDVTASLMVTDPAGHQVRVPAQPLHAEDGGMDCRRIYRKALSDLFKNAEALLASGPIHAAATGSGGPPAMAAPPPAAPPPAAP